MTKTIFAFGMNLPEVDGFVPMSLASERSMLDADIIAVEADLEVFGTSGTYQGTPQMTEGASATYRETKVRWKAQIEAAHQSGKTIVFFLTKKQSRFYYTGEKKNMGTPGRPRMSVIVNGCSNYDFIPILPTKISIAEGTGFKATPDGTTLLGQYWDEYECISAYRCYFRPAADWKVLLTTKGGEHAVAAFLPVGAGRLLLLPDLTWTHLNEFWSQAGYDDEEQDWPEEHRQFTLRLRDLLVALDRRLRSSGDRTEAPEWTTAPEYRLDSEVSIEANMLQLTERIEQLTIDHAELSAQRFAEGGLRDLLFETGPPLESAVRSALAVLGFKVEHFENDESEFDAIFVSAEGRFLGEVEGRDNKAIDVKKASQLHRNLSEDFSRDDVVEMATGVLFGNPFRLTPPQDREPSFTPKVVTFAQTVGLTLGIVDKA